MNDGWARGGAAEGHDLGAISSGARASPLSRISASLGGNDLIRANGIVEGLNLKWNLTVRIAFGFRTFKALEIASFH